MSVPERDVVEQSRELIERVQNGKTVENLQSAIESDLRREWIRGHLSGYDLGWRDASMFGWFFLATTVIFAVAFIWQVLT